jgi:protein-disulfide isomerase
MNKKILVLAAGALLTAVFALAAFLYENQKTSEVTEAASNTSLLKRYYSPTTGDVNAKVTIVEFFDPACETCKAFHPFVKELMQSNPGKIKLIMRYTPFHQGSDYVVKILEAAKLQNKFWETLEATYAAQSVWSQHGNPQPEKLWMHLGSIGLDLNKVKEDMQSLMIKKHIQQDMDDAKQLQVTKTPGFFVNGKPLTNFGSRQLKKLVEAEVRESYPM